MIAGCASRQVSALAHQDLSVTVKIIGETRGRSMKKSNRIASAVAAATGFFLAGLAGALAQTAAEATTEELAIDARDADIFARDKFIVETIVCPFKGEIKYKPGEISCGLLTVPENREKSRSRTIKLHFVKLHARKPEKWDEKGKGEWKRREDPIVYLTGGPGAQATGYVKRFVKHGVRDVRDLYILEQRGIGHSEDFCPKYGLFDPAASNKPEWEAYQRGAFDAMESCFAAAKAARVDLSAYNTIENARDVEALRRGLGFEKWNVWGISYGSILGQAYIKQDPKGIRAIVLDAIVPIVPGAHFQRIGQHYQRDLDLLESACADNNTCKRAFPDFQGRLKTAMTKVSETPIEVDAIDAELFPAGKAWFFQDIIGGAPFVSLYEQDTYSTLPAFIDALARKVENSDHDAFRLATAAGPGGGGFSISQGMYNAIACNDGWWGKLHDALVQDRADHPVLASMMTSPEMINEIAALCKRYGMPPRDEAQYAAVETDIPAIIANGEMDPITPPPLAEEIVPGFANGTYVEFPYAGHGPTRSVECAGDFLTKFFDDPRAVVDTTCADAMKAPAFTGKLYQTEALTRLASLAAEGEKKIVAPALWAGASALVLFIALIVYAIAPVARLINRDPAVPTLGARPLAFLTALLGAIAVGGIGFGGYATFEANEMLLLVGMLGWTRWFVIAGVLAGIAGAGVMYLTVKARAQKTLPIGTLTGLVVTAIAGVSLAAFLLLNGFSPI